MDFNLVDEAWLPVVLNDGSMARLSLREVLARAHEVHALALETASQLPPVIRLLLAVLHRALGGPTGDRQWREWWFAGRFDAEPVEAYLAEHRSRFNLFDPAVPFMQAGGLEALNGQTKTVALIIPHVATGNNVPLFSGQRDARPEALDPARAARWLLHTHAWDTAAIKTGAVGDPRARAGKTVGNPVGSLGQLGVAMPTGPSLWHTLMCNLLPVDAQTLAADKPVWERAALTARWDDAVLPSGPVSLFTWPSRRIRLLPETDPASGQPVVRQVLVCAGDRLPLSSGHELRHWLQCEPHTAWKRSTNLERRHSFRPVYWPVRHAPDRQLWRGLGSLLARAEALGAGPGNDAAALQGPRALAQLGSRGRRALLRDVPVQVLAVGLEYGTQSSVVTEAYADTLPLPVALLSAEDRTWRDAVLEAVEATSRAVATLAQLAHHLAVAAGCRPEEEGLLAGHRRRAREQAYAALDGQFRTWLATLQPEEADPEPAQDAWATTVRRILHEHAADLLDGASPAAFRGREITHGDSTQRYDAALAELTFRAALNKALANLQQPDDTPPTTSSTDGQRQPELESTAR
ncbi:type I-E CRISPR-associated protein Cse1/CasA [Streptomyces sp. NPDC101209]|uniref:type I-E CRISPR-associated protein Cse1/CasA n=1 Tax=Streptomyces sp. NPDC101209 TaxID=3366129 RepID=UPI0038155727